MGPVPANIMRISTRDLPEHNRIAAICELYGRTILKHDIEPIGDQPFEFESKYMNSLPGLALASTTIAPCHAPRGPQHIDGDDLVLSVVLTGGRVVRQRGREAVVGESEAVLTASDDPGAVTITRASTQFSLRMARTVLRHGTCRFRRLPVTAGAARQSGAAVADGLCRHDSDRRRAFPRRLRCAALPSHIFTIWPR